MPVPVQLTMPAIGIISDTHGLLRPQAVDALRGAVRILHAGDIGRAEIIEELAALAPVTAVRGNNDRGAWARGFPEQALLTIGAHRILLVHELADLQRAMRALAVEPTIVITGHSHKPLVVERDGVLFVNPGSAGPRRFKLPVTLATLQIQRGRARAQIQELPIS
jgi:putative phosphoesterase